MLTKDLTKHAGEFLNALQTNRYERTEDGIFFPGANVEAVGIYTHDVNGLDVRHDRNKLTDQGLMHMLNVEFHTTAKITAWYIALWGGNITPQADYTAANFATNASEIVSNTEGYTETTRQLYQSSASVMGTVDSLPGIVQASAMRAAFTIATATSLTVYGAALLSSNVKGDTAGVLASISRFSAPRILANTDVFNCGYSIGLRSAT